MRTWLTFAWLFLASAASAADRYNFATLADLAAWTPSTRTPYFTVDAYDTNRPFASPRPGHYSATSVAATNAGCVFATSTGTGRNIMDDCDDGDVDIRWFGASESLTNNAVEIQSALDWAVNTDNKSVFIPGGTFYLTTTLTNRGANITGIGWRPQGSWLWWSGANDGYIMNLGAGTLTVGVTISKVGFQGNYVGNGMYWDGAGNSSMSDCRIDGPRSMGLMLTNSVNVTLAGNRFTYGYATNTVLVGTAIGSGHIFVANIFTGEGRGLVNMGAEGGTLQVIGNSFGPLFTGVERQDVEYHNGGAILANYFEFCYAGSILVGVTTSPGMGTNTVASTNRFGSLLIAGNELGVAHGSALNPTVIIDKANHVTLSDNEIWALVTVTTNANNVVIKDNQLVRSPIAYGDYSIGATTLYYSDGYDSGNTNKITTGYWQLGYQGAMQLSAPFWADQTVEHGPKLEFGGTYIGATNAATMWSRLEFNAGEESLPYFPGGSMTASVLNEGGSGTWLPMWHARPRRFDLLCPSVVWTNTISGPRIETLFGLSALWASENTTVGVGSTNAQFRGYGTDTTATERGGMIQFGGRVVGTTTNWPWAEIRGMSHDSATNVFPGGELQMWVRDDGLNWRKTAEFTPTRVDLLKPVIPPKLTTAELAALTAVETGLLAFNTTSNLFQWYNGSAFVPIGAASYHNDLSGLQGGTSGEYYHLSSTDYNDVQTLIGNDPYLPLTAGDTVPLTGDLVLTNSAYLRVLGGPVQFETYDSGAWTADGLIHSGNGLSITSYSNIVASALGNITLAPGTDMGLYLDVPQSSTVTNAQFVVRQSTNGPVMTLPAPASDGAYVLFVTNGVASWIAHP